MIEFIIGAFLYAKLKKKHSLKHVFKTWHIYLPLIFAVIYIYLEACVFMRNYWFIPYQQMYKTLTLLSYLPLILHYKLYESVSKKLKNKGDFINIITSPMVIGTFLIALGTILNLMVIKANNGYMPVFISLSYATGYATRDMVNDGLHILGGYDTRLIPLSDLFDTGFSIMSIGDLFTRMYAFIILYFSIKNSTKL